MKQVLQDISKELHEYIRDTGFILVVLDSMTLPVLTKKSKHKIKELKNVEEHIFHPGGDSNHYCSMMTNMPRSYATYPDLPIPAFLQKRQGWPKKGRDPGPKCKEKSKSLPFCPRSLHFCPKSLHFVFLKGAFDPQKGRDLKCKDLGQNARIFFGPKYKDFFYLSMSLQS